MLKVSKKFRKENNAIKIDFLISVTDLNEILESIEKNGHSIGYKPIATPNDFREFILDAIWARVRKMEV